MPAADQAGWQFDAVLSASSNKWKQIVDSVEQTSNHKMTPAG
jgi:hypothetical protein